MALACSPWVPASPWVPVGTCKLVGTCKPVGTCKASVVRGMILQQSGRVVGLEQKVLQFYALAVMSCHANISVADMCMHSYQPSLHERATTHFCFILYHTARPRDKWSSGRNAATTQRSDRQRSSTEYVYMRSKKMKNLYKMNAHPAMPTAKPTHGLMMPCKPT